MPETIAEIFKRIAKVVRASVRDNHPSSFFNHPSSAWNHPSSDLNHPTSKYNFRFSECNRPSASKQVRRDALKELVDKYLSKYLDDRQREEIIELYSS
jgi:hypothetical protein